MTPEELIHLYFAGQASGEQVAELDRLLEADADLRRKFVFEAGNDAALREIALERASDSPVAEGKVSTPLFRPAGWMAAAASLVLLAALTWTQISKPDVIATLVSAEDASWESSLPTSPGSDLTQGYLKLTSGIATIRFRSGAEVLLEAPANLVLESPMKGRLLRGAALIDVPDSAIGFIMETPDGFAVDHGTRFAVSVGSDEGGGTDFEVLDGEISVFHPDTESEVRLKQNQATTVTGKGLEKIEGPLPETRLVKESGVRRIGTGGNSWSVIANNDEDYIHPDFLMVKKSTGKEDFDRRAIFSFDLEGQDQKDVESARLRLNLVPSGVGYASHLPKINRFALFGFGAAVDRGADQGWSDAPLPENGELLATFELPRSQHRGMVGIDTEALFHFLQKHQQGAVTFLLLRETSETESRGLVHAFASDSHPESSGPILEFFTRKKPENPNE